MKQQREKYVTFGGYIEKNLLSTNTGKVVMYIVIGIGILYGSKYLFNGLAESIRKKKNLKQSIKE